MSSNFNINNIDLIIGLGNPGKKYENTYHNIGIIFINYLKNNQSLADVKVEKSNNYMNNSGISVQKKIDYYSTSPKKTLVIHDDSDLKIGDYKTSFNKGSAGHKGVNSIISHLDTKKFWRLRIGIRPKEYKGKAEKFVLNKITNEHKEKFKKVFKKILQEIQS